MVQVGIFVIIAGLLIVFFSALAGANKDNARFSVFGLIGFIPFGFANDKQLFMVSIIVAILFILITAVIALRTL